MPVETALSGLPRYRLVPGPTPLERLDRLAAHVGHHGLYAKRDDCMALGMGGNKLRSLEFWLGEALVRQADTLLVAGRRTSNQCRLTAAAAAKCGLRCIVLHNDDPPERAEGNLLLSRLYGAETRFLGPMEEDERSRRLAELAEQMEASGYRCYIVGDPVVGALGYVACAAELIVQAGEQEAALENVILPGSMGPTEAGFLFGCALAGAPFRVHLVSVEYGIDRLAYLVEDLFSCLCAHTGVTPSVKPASFVRYHERYLGAGYDIPTPEAVAALQTVAALEGMLLEATYTAKTFAGALDLIERGEIASDSPTCLIHTGGVPSFFTQAGDLGLDRL
ncbi:pyridoxal-phosphate dependent enzyme [Fodinicurvata sediminis]|uniref:pyridoxal-phosphate dependent enzyme n=1 Tax=Fodinicurvata sediminis TaxID=1121832 RepID=UPI0003B58A37|nr:pyridoxal-phosphate dependent enzyme [Fodinicurvata sediminis]